MIAARVPARKKPKFRLPQALIGLADPQFQNELEDFAVCRHDLQRRAVVAG
jgi:hypothetical protein